MSYMVTVAIAIMIAVVIGKAKGYKIEKEDILLSVGIVLLAFQIDRRGFDWALDNFISLFIAITLFDFIRAKVKRWEERS